MIKTTTRSGLFNEHFDDKLIQQGAYSFAAFEDLDRAITAANDDQWMYNQDKPETNDRNRMNKLDR